MRKRANQKSLVNYPQSVFFSFSDTIRVLPVAHEQVISSPKYATFKVKFMNSCTVIWGLAWLTDDGATCHSLFTMRSVTSVFMAKITQNDIWNGIWSQRWISKYTSDKEVLFFVLEEFVLQISFFIDKVIVNLSLCQAHLMAVYRCPYLPMRYTWYWKASPGGGHEKEKEEVAFYAKC